MRKTTEMIKGNMRSAMNVIKHKTRSKMYMNRVTILMMAFLLTAVLTGCSGGDATTQEEPTEQGNVAETAGTENHQETEGPVIEIVVDTKESMEPVTETAPDDEIQEEASENQTSNADARVVVWGDSLTEGTGGDGVTYPNVLEKLAGCEVKNYGVYAEATTCIAGRQGGMPQLVHPVTIPAEVTDVDVQIENGDGGWDMILVFGDAGINPCTIAGIEGRLWIDADTGQRKFTRSAPGEEVVLTEGTPIETFAMKDKRPDDILVIFTGSNDDPTPATVQNVIDVQRDMIAYAGVDRYVIIGLTSKRKMPMAAEVNEVFAKEYGEHFLDVRKDLLEHGLQDSGIEATEEDKADIANGMIPRSLLTDESHGNAAYYTVIGEQLYKKMQELGYLK